MTSGTLNLQIVPEKNQETQLCQWLKKSFPKSHLFSCTPFVIMQLNTDGSRQAFFSIQNSSLVKTVNIH